MHRFVVPIALITLACSSGPDGFTPNPGAAGSEPGGLAAGATEPLSGTAPVIGGGGAAGATLSDSGPSEAGALVEGGGANVAGQGGGAGAPVAGAPQGGSPQAGAPAGGSSGAPQGGMGGGGTAGAGGSAPNACEPPTDPFVDCTGKCGGGSCSSCAISKDLLGDADTQYERSVVIKANSGGACGSPACDGTVYAFALYQGACAKLSAMPMPLGKTPPKFSQNTAFGDPRCEAWSPCLIAKGHGASNAPDRLSNIYVSSGTADAWIHAEAAALNPDGTCPLSCP